MINLNKIVDIARNRGESEIICTKCGSINELTEEMVQVTTAKDYKKRYSAKCIDCNSYVKPLHAHTVERIFFKGSMHEVPKLNTGLIIWMLQENFNKGKHEEELNREIQARMREPKQLKLGEDGSDYIKEFRAYLSYLSKELKELHEMKVIHMDSLTLEQHREQIETLERELTHFQQIQLKL